MLRVIRRAGSCLKEFLGEFVGEVVLTVAACLVVAGLALAFVRGWQRGPLVTGGVGGALLLLLVYGGWELLCPSRPGRRGPLAGAATAAFVLAVLLLVHGWPCDCL
ncbi:hypothetical protein ACFQWA_21040 [Streptomyces thermogriseus]|uniref:Integral membrane protein n=1 Tax=Streptomyces thermogriseus TaxID=75292 RepID=A0ABN1SUF3_9ACTN